MNWILCSKSLQNISTHNSSAKSLSVTLKTKMFLKASNIRWAIILSLEFTRTIFGEDKENVFIQFYIVATT